jgi:hypothetical protein
MFPKPISGTSGRAYEGLAKGFKGVGKGFEGLA